VSSCSNRNGVRWRAVEEGHRIGGKRRVSRSGTAWALRGERSGVIVSFGGQLRLGRCMPGPVLQPSRTRMHSSPRLVG
jgi:hypothetical protein